MNVLPVILAGGLGTRLAPHSSAEKPKAFLKRNGATLLKHTYERCRRVSSEITVILHQDHLALAEEVEALKIAESQRNGTTFAIALAALYSMENAGCKKILICPCDHEFEDESEFVESVSRALSLKKDAVLFGVNPDAPSTEFGYIEADEDAMTVKAFHEKPDELSAQAYMKSGRHFWNAGIFLLDPNWILKQIQRYAPRIYGAAWSAWEKREAGEMIKTPPVEQNFEALSVDYAVLEKAERLAFVEIKTGWRDLGTPEEFFKKR